MIRALLAAGAVGLLLWALVFGAMTVAIARCDDDTITAQRDLPLAVWLRVAPTAVAGELEMRPAENANRPGEIAVAVRGPLPQVLRFMAVVRDEGTQ